MLPNKCILLVHNTERAKYCIKWRFGIYALPILRRLAKFLKSKSRIWREEMCKNSMTSLALTLLTSNPLTTMNQYHEKERPTGE